MRLPFLTPSVAEQDPAEHDLAGHDVPDRPPTPEGNVDPILLPDEVILQIFPKKLCSYRELPAPRQGFFGYNEPEYHHSYLTKKSKMGALWVTTLRLMVVPTEPGEKGCSIDILDVESMKPIESDLKVWFFLANVELKLHSRDAPDRPTKFIFTAPFSTQLRAKAFVKLISNLRFEHEVRRALPPPYRHRLESFYDGQRPCLESVLRPGSPNSEGSIEDAIEEAIEDEEQDWQDNDRHLPSYNESEDAVERYLIERGLLSEDGTPLAPADAGPALRLSSTHDSSGHDASPGTRPLNSDEDSTASANELRRITSRPGPQDAA